MRHAAHCLLFVSTFGALAAQTTPNGFAETSVPDALQRANGRRCAVLIDFSSPGCEPCRRLEQTTWKDASVLEWLGAHTIAIRSDPEKDPALAKEHRIDAYPTVVLLGADGKEKGRIVGYLDAVVMQQRLDELLEAQSTDWRTRERLGDALAARGDKDGALQHYLWCWDHGLAHNPSMVGVRSSFFLTKLLGFAQSCPAARPALESRRDDAEKRILAGDLGFAAVQDMTRLNEHLEASPRLLAVLEKIPVERWKKKDAVARRVLFAAVLEQLVAARRYADILRLGGDPQEQLAAQLPWLKGLRMPADFRERQTAHVLDTFVPLVEASYGTRDNKAAVALANKLLELRADASTWLRLIAAAKRAGNDVAAQDLVVRALQELPEDQHDTIRSSLKAK